MSFKSTIISLLFSHEWQQVTVPGQRFPGRSDARFGLNLAAVIVTLPELPKEEESMAKPQDEKGLTIIYTGNGKGKTTAALGMCIRAAGYKRKIKILQFVKGSWKYGELEGIKLLKDFVDMEQVGEGFVGIIDDDKDYSVHQEAAHKGLELARQVMHSDQYDIVILDELNIAVDLGLVSLEQVIDLVKGKPEKLHLVITGRNAPPELIELADLVTEMKEVKHPYQKGILAQRAIDW
jgi:cob(I)alamin adenosyltransferase